MEKRLNFSYDQEGDVLDISLGKPQKAISEEVKEDFYVRLKPNTKEVVGFMILNFSSRFRKEKASEVPIMGHFNLAKAR